MDVLEAIKERRSVRAFLDKTVDEQTIKSILEVARWAPSGVNHQPWQVCVLGKQARRNIGQAIIQARESGTPENPDYNYYPQTWVDPYKTRRKKCGLAMYSALDIAYEDKARRKEQWFKNYHFFHAPCGLIFYLDTKLSTGSWMDMGAFIQNVMIAARGHGLDSCAQAALAEYPDIVRETLGLSKNVSIVCGMALGYADWDDPVNQYRTEREDINEFVQWFD